MGIKDFLSTLLKRKQEEDKTKIQVKQIVVEIEQENLASTQDNQELELESDEDNSDIPQPVQELSTVIKSIPGIKLATVNRYMLFEITSDDFTLPIFGDYPLGALKRTDGGLSDEILISIDFMITRDETGLKALEFLSWWVRDHARGGDSIQLRALALPPIPEQFGKTLTFTIDYFYTDPEQDIDKLLNSIQELADSLNNAKIQYLNQ